MRHICSSMLMEPAIKCFKTMMDFTIVCHASCISHPHPLCSDNFKGVLRRGVMNKATIFCEHLLPVTSCVGKKNTQKPKPLCVIYIGCHLLPSPRHQSSLFTRDPPGSGYR
jgi:hypothetical protein